MDDVDLENGRIIIRESKGWKARNVYMSSDVLEQCRKYQDAISKIMPLRDAFFPNKYGKRLSYYTLNNWFHEFWDTLPEAKADSAQNACLHSFRHTFAVDRLNGWIREGKDVSALYVYLSEYMGHADYKATDYYLRLVSEFHPDMERLLASINEEILPEVYYGKE